MHNFCSIWDIFGTWFNANKKNNKNKANVLSFARGKKYEYGSMGIYITPNRTENAVNGTKNFCSLAQFLFDFELFLNLIPRQKEEEQQQQPSFL